MLAIDYKKARELFAQMPAPRIPALTCDDPMVYDVSIFYVAAGEIAARAFNAKEIADEQPFHLLQRYTSDLTSPEQIAPIARMLAGAPLKAQQLEALVGTLAGVLQSLSGDDRSFSAALSGDTDAAIAALQEAAARRTIDAQPLLDAWHSYVARQKKETRCGDPKPAGQCATPECRQLAKQFTTLVMAPSGYGLTAEQKSTAEWGAKLRQYLAALAAWTQDDDPAEYFQFKSRFYTQLFSLAPEGPERDLVLSALLAFVQQNAYARDHRAEWFYPVNALIVQAFSNPAAMKTTVRDLRRCADPVIAMYAQLEQLLPRPMDVTLGLL